MIRRKTGNFTCSLNNELLPFLANLATTLITLPRSCGISIFNRATARAPCKINLYHFLKRCTVKFHYNQSTDNIRSSYQLSSNIFLGSFQTIATQIPPSKYRRLYSVVTNKYWHNYCFININVLAFSILEKEEIIIPEINKNKHSQYIFSFQHQLVLYSLLLFSSLY